MLLTLAQVKVPADKSLCSRRQVGVVFLMKPLVLVPRAKRLLVDPTVVGHFQMCLQAPTIQRHPQVRDFLALRPVKR